MVFNEDSNLLFSNGLLVHQASDNLNYYSMFVCYNVEGELAGVEVLLGHPEVKEYKDEGREEE